MEPKPISPKANNTKQNLNPKPCKGNKATRTFFTLADFKGLAYTQQT